MRVLRVFYAISAVIIVIAGVFILVSGLFGSSEAGEKILVVIGAPLGTFLYLILARLWVEFLANLYRIGDNTQALVDKIPTE